MLKKRYLAFSKFLYGPHFEIYERKEFYESKNFVRTIYLFL